MRPALVDLLLKLGKEKDFFMFFLAVFHTESDLS